jgi:hypothetical protein
MKIKYEKIFFRFFGSLLDFEFDNYHLIDMELHLLE